MATTVPKVLSVNVGTPREFEYGGRLARSAIWKSPVPGRIAARGVNLNGDNQADRQAHGGPDKVIYAYAIEDLRWWEQEIGRSLAFGEFGENLTTEGIEVNNALVGERWAVGTTVLEVSEPRIPCWRLGVRMNDSLFPRHFTQAERHGWHACRRGLGSNLYRLGVPDKTIQQILRHSNVNVTLNYYVKTASPDVVAAMAKLEETLSAQSLLDTKWTPKSDSDAMPGLVN